LLLTAADYARVKVFTVSISESLANLSSSSEPTVQIQPVALTATGTASNLQPLKDGRLVFSKHSLTSPIDIYTLAPLSPTSKLGRNQVVERRLTNFANKYLKGKDLVEPEEVWFEGAKRRKVHGWVIKPPEFRKGAHKAHPVKKNLFISTIRADLFIGYYAHSWRTASCLP
jgi:dipeptidyl aminopeptidase/acylaminoacyl peptidase